MPKILIADDRPENRFVLINFFKLLGPNSNIEYFEADNSVDAVNIAKKEKPELVLLDIKMETNDAGLTAAEKIREDETIKDIQIWAITAQAMDERDGEDSDRDKCLKAGCNDYLTKPFDPVKLLTKTSKLFNIEIPQNIRTRMGI
ncbi:MAG TPA: response regulator [Spirochaetota bacterium]|jgi:CheY-like chemotaxis protein|nr:MAG: Response regulator PleD [Spirochaetes bacterium ADurb.Bin133]HNZ27573.1 response regulator [Spirochaetota bacterium]HOF01133.1 response regulator [Spirochaetota bacterium]HOS32212.1 response regulator [Spirochaetota bacterium]HOS55643.1 response regulator [Spirochaetota bacterium]